MSVVLTKHFIERFSERQAKTKRVDYFADMAFRSGQNAAQTKFGQFTKEIEKREKINSSIAKVYKGFIYWFKDNVAVTIYPLPNKYRAKV